MHFYIHNTDYNIINAYMQLKIDNNSIKCMSLKEKIYNYII